MEWKKWTDSNHFVFDIHQKKVMLYVWRNFKGKDFCYQPDKPNNAFRIERPELIDRKGFVCHQDKPRSHTSFVIRQKLLKLEWDTMPHLLYISDPTPSDYYLNWNSFYYMLFRRCFLNFLNFWYLLCWLWVFLLAIAKLHLRLFHHCLHLIGPFR